MIAIFVNHGDGSVATFAESSRQAIAMFLNLSLNCSLFCKLLQVDTQCCWLKSCISAPMLFDAGGMLLALCNCRREKSLARGEGIFGFIQ
jgi:hypothetical protein